MKIRSNDIHAVYKKTKTVYITVMDRITDRRVQSTERFKELCKLADNLHYAVNHLRRFL
jgi:hypothetical protein